METGRGQMPGARYQMPGVEKCGDWVRGRLGKGQTGERG
jgi:hypothetical protein